MKNTKPGDDHAGDSSIDERAAEWLVQRARGLTDVEAAEFSAWMKRNPQHRAAFGSLEQTWHKLDRMAELRLPDGRSIDADIPAATGSLRQSPRRRRNMIFFSAALVAAAAAVLMMLKPQMPMQTAPALVQNAETSLGQREKMDLPDGSVVWLNTETAVEVRFDAKERRIVLRRGEASFNVAKNPARPFIVRVGQVDVRAVGTVFNVRLHSSKVEVLVTEGTVRVERPAETGAPGTTTMRNSAEVAAGAEVVVPMALITVGQKATVSAENEPSVVMEATVSAVDTAEAARELAWQEGRLDFRSTALDRIVSEFNRYNVHKLVIADPRLNERRFGGTFRTDNADAFVRLLEDRFGIEAERSADETKLRLGK